MSEAVAGQLIFKLDVLDKDIQEVVKKGKQAGLALAAGLNFDDAANSLKEIVAEQRKLITTVNDVVKSSKRQKQAAEEEDESLKALKAAIRAYRDESIALIATWKDGRVVNKAAVAELANLRNILIGLGEAAEGDVAALKITETAVFNITKAIQEYGKTSVKGVSENLKRDIDEQKAAANALADSFLRLKNSATLKEIDVGSYKTQLTDLSAKVLGFAQVLQKEFPEARNEINKLSNAAVGIQKELDKLDKKNEEVAQSTEEVTKAKVKAVSIAEQYRNKIRNLDAQTRTNLISNERAIKSFDALTKEMLELQRAGKLTEKEFSDLSVQISRTASSSDRLQGKINGLSFANQIKQGNTFAGSIARVRGELASVLAGAGIIQLTRALDANARSFFDAQVSATLYVRELEKANISQTEGQLAAQRLTDNLRTTQDVVENGAVQLLRYGATIEQVETLLTAGAASGLAFGRTTSQGIEAIAQAIVGEQSQILNRIGIAGNLSTAYLQYARDLGVATDSLTEQQKVTAAVTMITKETASEVEALDTIFSGFGGSTNRLSVTMTLFRRELGEQLIPVLNLAYNTASLLLELFTAAPSAVQRFILGLIGLGTAITGVTVAATALRAIALPLLGPTGLIIAGVSAVGALAFAMLGGGGLESSTRKTQQTLTDYNTTLDIAYLATQELSKAIANPSEESLSKAVGMLASTLDEEGQASLLAYADTFIYPLLAIGQVDQALSNLGIKVIEVFREIITQTNTVIQDQINKIRALDKIAGNNIGKQLTLVETRIDPLQTEVDRLEAILANPPGNATERYLVSVKENIEDLNYQIKNYYAELNALNATGIGLGTEVNGLLASVEANEATVERLNNLITDYQNGTISLEDIIGGFNKTLKDVGVTGGATGSKVDDLSGNLDRANEKLSDGERALQNYNKALAILNSEFERGNTTKLERDIAEYKLVRDTINELQTATGGLNSEQQTLLDTLLAYEPIIRGLAQATQDAVQATQDYVKKLRMQYEQGLIGFEELNSELEFQAEKLKAQLVDALNGQDLAGASRLEERLNAVLGLMGAISFDESDLTLYLTSIRGFGGLEDNPQDLGKEIAADIQKGFDESDLTLYLTSIRGFGGLEDNPRDLGKKIAADIQKGFDESDLTLYLTSIRGFGGLEDIPQDLGKEIAAAMFNDGLDALSDATEEYISMTGDAPSQVETFIASLERLKAIYPEIADELQGLINKLELFQAKSDAESNFIAIAEGIAKGANIAEKIFTTDFSNGNSILDTYYNVAADLAELVPVIGPALSQALRAVGSAINAVIGDMSNGIKQVREEIEELAKSFPLLAEETVKTLATTERVSRGGLLGFFGLTKEQINQEATAITLDIANTIAQASLTGLVDGFDNFDEAFEKLYKETIAKAILSSAEFQERIINLTRLIESLANPDLSPEERAAIEAQIATEKAALEEDVNKARADYGLDTEEKPADGSLADLNNQLSELKAKLELLPIGSSEFNEILKQIEALEERISNATDREAAAEAESNTTEANFSSINPATQIAVAIPLINAASQLDKGASKIFNASTRLENAAARIERVFAQGIAVDVTSNGSSQNVINRTALRRQN